MQYLPAEIRVTGAEPGADTGAEGEPGWRAVLNQDGSWSVAGRMPRAVLDDAYLRCLAEALADPDTGIMLRREEGDNSRFPGWDALARVIEADPVLRRCAALTPGTERGV